MISILSKSTEQKTPNGSFSLLFNGIISISTYKKVATVVFYIELPSRNLTLPNYAKFFGAFRGSGTQIPRLTNPIFAFSKTLVLVPISSSKTCRLQNFLKLFSSPVVFLWVTGRVGCLLKAINIPIFVYSIMSSGRSYHPRFYPPLSSPRTGHNPLAAPRCATLRPNLSRVVWLVDEGRYPGWLDWTPKNIGRPWLYYDT